MRWIWIDRFVTFESGKSASTVKNLSLAEDHFGEHFPGYPVMPAAVMIEGLAQTGGILVGEANGYSKNVVLAKIGKATFKREAGWRIFDIHHDPDPVRRCRWAGRWDRSRRRRVDRRGGDLLCTRGARPVQQVDGLEGEFCLHGQPEEHGWLGEAGILVDLSLTTASTVSFTVSHRPCSCSRTRLDSLATQARACVESAVVR